MGVGRERVALLAGAAALLAACTSAAPVPAAPAAGTAAAGAALTVYVSASSDGCDSASLSGAAWSGDTLVLSEDTCEPGAGDEDAPARQPRLVALAGTTSTVLAAPPGEQVFPVVEAAAPDGTVYAVVSRGQDEVALWGLRDGRWSRLTGALPRGHTGDGGPAAAAGLDRVVDVDVTSDGSVLVLEPFAVRRVAPDGTVTTIAGTDREDGTSGDPVGTWGAGASGGLVLPDPRPVPAAPVVATSVPLPELTALAVDADDTVWLAASDAVLRLDRDGVLTTVVDAATAEPDGPAAALVGRRGSSSRITALVPRADGLHLLDAWSGRVLRLDGRRLSLLAGRPPTGPASCAEPTGAGAGVDLQQVCARDLVDGGDLGLLAVTSPGALLALPTG